MGKRIGWNLDSTEHAMFNWLRPIPVYSKAPSQFNRASVNLPERPYIISSLALHMVASRKRIVFQASVVIFILLWATAISPEPPAHISISPGELVRAVTIGRQSLIDLCLIEQVDPNGRDAQGRTPLLITTLQQDWKTARRRIEPGALVDLADKKGFTPSMASAMHGNPEMFRLLLARSTNLHAEARDRKSTRLN